VSRFSAQDLANSIWGVSVIGGFGLKFYRRLWERCLEMEFSEVDRHGVLMMYQGYLLMEAAVPETSKTMPAPRWLHAEAKQLWVEQAATKSRAGAYTRPLLSST
jgi:hypothetical protein